jgi:hypothetical protein
MDLWDSGTLLALVDTARRCIAEGRRYGPEYDRLSVFLKTVYADEVLRVTTVELDTIEAAHLDKLLAEMTGLVNNPTVLGHARLGTDIYIATKLQRLWRTQFKASYFELDETRAENLVTTGRLRGVTFVAPPSLDFPLAPLWKATRLETITEPEEDEQQLMAGE